MKSGESSSSPWRVRKLCSSFDINKARCVSIASHPVLIAKLHENLEASLQLLPNNNLPPWVPCCLSFRSLSCPLLLLSPHVPAGAPLKATQSATAGVLLRVVQFVVTATLVVMVEVVFHVPPSPQWSSARSQFVMAPAELTELPYSTPMERLFWPIWLAAFLQKLLSAQTVSQLPPECPSSENSWMFSVKTEHVMWMPVQWITEQSARAPRLPPFVKATCSWKELRGLLTRIMEGACNTFMRLFTRKGYCISRGLRFRVKHLLICARTLNELRGWSGF